MFRFCFVFSENTKIYAALSSPKLKQKKPVKCCIGYCKDLYLLLQINKADTIMIKFSSTTDLVFLSLESKFLNAS